MSSIFIIIGIVVVLSVIFGVLEVAGEVGVEIVEGLREGIFGKLVLTCLVLAGGCFIWNIITPYAFIPVIGKWFLVAAVLIVVIRIIMKIFSTKN